MSGVTEILSREHREVLRRLDELERAIAAYDTKALREILRFFDEQLPLHRQKEEMVLFPALARYVGSEVGPVACMLQEHEEERRHLEELRSALTRPDSPASRETALRAGCYILTLLRNHIAKEDGILFPLAEDLLSPEEKERVRAGMEAIGSCCPECAVQEA